MVVAPGFSLTDIIQAVDTTATIIVQLKEAPNVLQSVIKGIEFSRSVLKSWRRQMEDRPEDIHEDDLDLLVGVKSEYDSIIEQLEAFVKKHRRLENGSLGARFKWVITEHFLNERDGLETSLKDVEARMRTVLQTLNWSTSREILRRTSSFAQQGQQRSEGPPASQICHSPEMLPQPNGLNILHTLCEQAEQLPNNSDNGDTFQLPSLPPPASSSSSPRNLGQSGFHWNPQFTISDCAIQDGSSEAVETSPGYDRARNVILVRGESASTVGTAHYASSSISSASTFSSTSTRSSTATEYSPVEAIRPSISSINPLPASPCSVNAGSISSGRVGPSSPTRPSPSATLVASPVLTPLSRSLPPPMIERMPIKGEIRIWYRAQQRYYDKVLRDLEIARSSGRGALRVQMTTKLGTGIVHRGSATLTDMAMIVIPQQGHVPDHILQIDSRIKYLIKFREQHELCAGTNEDVFFTGIPQYSFTDEKDYESFQTMIRGKTNQFNTETLTISISGDKVISDSQVLQIWDNKGTRTIRFFRNATDHNFSEYKIAGLKPYSSKKKELKLEFRNGYDDDNFKKLKIIFTTESARAKFEQLAQFSNG